MAFNPRRLKARNAHEHNPRRSGLARALSKLGYCSRSDAAELIRAGRVALNSAIRRNPETPVELSRDKILVDGAPIAAAQKIYLMLNKPRGIVTSASDEKGRETIYSLLPKQSAWLAPVGRLDKASEGLLLLTNDSEWGARIAAPETHLEKTYHVQIGAKFDEAALEKLRAGVRDSGELLRAKSIEILREGERNSWLEIRLDEGKNRQIRRMLAACGIEVLRLLRIAIGPIKLGDLAKGASRELTPQEKESLDRTMHGTRRQVGRR
jgi:23S rRNA pseudouridine2605 synthase